MAVCGNRTDTPGFFTSCDVNTNNGCVCATQVKADLAEAARAEQVQAHQRAHLEWLASGGGAA